MQAARGASLTPRGQAGDETGPPSDDPTTRSPRPRRRLLLVLGVIALAGWMLDQATKAAMVATLSDGSTVSVVGELVQLHLTYNPGAAFNLGTSYTVVLSFISIGAVLVVLWLARRLGSAGWAVSLGFLLSGVLGNLTDRLVRDPAPLRGEVVDFVMLPNFPLFNIADVCINVAAGLIIVQALRGIKVDGTRHEDGPAVEQSRGERR